MSKPNPDSTWKPQRKSGQAPTVRDGSNLLLIMTPITTITSWILHDAVGLDCPPEVASAFGGLIGYVVARKLRY